MAITPVLFAVTPMQGRADFVVVAYTMGAACYLVAAARAEGRRGAVDRLMGLLMVTAFGLYYAGSDVLRAWTGYVHIAAGLALPMLFGMHLLLGRRSRPI